MISHDNKYYTNNKCPNSGTWACSIHVGDEIFILNGEIFPKCGHGSGHDAIWWELDENDQRK